MISSSFLLIDFYLFYWFILGILGSIWIGFGISTGALFLFPDIARKSIESDTDNFYEIFQNVFPQFFAWSIGTAIGESSAYFLSTYYPLDSIIYINNLKYGKCIYRCTKNMIIKYNIYAIFLLSCWPNITFDMCGYMCGQFKISYFKFICGTMLGKFVKTIGQVILIIKFLISPEYTKYLLENIPYVGQKIIFLLDNYKENEQFDIFNYIWYFCFSILSIFLLLKLKNIKSYYRKINRYLK